MSETTVPPNTVTPRPKQTKARYSTLRRLILSLSFLLVLVNPFVNLYLHNNFIQGWYQSLGIGKLWFVSPLEGLESLIIGKIIYLPSLLGMLVPLLIAFFLGRVFCSWVCPISCILEIVDSLRRIVGRNTVLNNRLVLAKKVLWFTLIADLLLSMILGAPLFVFLSPPGLVGREIMMAVYFHKLAIEGAILLVLIFLEFVTRRMFCRSFCPLGALLALIGKRRSLRVSLEKAQCTGCGRCNRTCPMGLQPEHNEADSPYCWNCGECIDACRYDSLSFRWRENGTRHTVSASDQNILKQNNMESQQTERGT